MIMGKSSGPKTGVGSAPILRFRVFELPLKEVREYGVIDYGGVSGAFGDDGFAVPDGKDLLGELKEKAKSSSSASMPSDRQTTEARISRISGQSDSGQAQSTGLCQPFDNVEHFEHKNNEIIGNGPTSASQEAWSRFSPDER